MSISDVMLPIIAATMLIMGFVGGCDRERLQYLENKNREYRERIHKLEMDVLDLRYNPKWRYNIQTKGGVK